MSFELLCHLAENWETGVQSLAWAKSLTPGFAIIKHFYDLVISVRIESHAET